MHSHHIKPTSLSVLVVMRDIIGLISDRSDIRDNLDLERQMLLLAVI